jgi:subtilisin family serine protease
MKHLLTILTCFLLIQGRAQQSRHIIELTDKHSTPYSLGQPSAFLSPKAIERRNRYNISLDSTDLPIPPAYLDSIRAAGSVTILNQSKWLNQVLVRTNDPAALAKIQSLPFVKKASPIAARPTQVIAPADKFDETVTDFVQGANRTQSINDNFYQYGNSFDQVHIHEGEFLHDHGFRGEGMTVAVLDGGFLGYLTNPAFDSVRQQNLILGTWDFVKNEASVNEDHVHGMYCFSVMAANRPGILVGTAPRAKYYLFRTEDVSTEYPVEEQNWAAAAELADSLGVDLITSSLGYNQFDDPALNHVYQDMDGNTTIVTRAADMAAKKGMIVTNSAGNSGAQAWKYIIAPADGDSVLAVAAVNVNGLIASFSSFGPSADGRVKPDVASVGSNTYVANTLGNAGRASGTSFANPNMAGLITCLWQAFPEFTNMEILDAVKRNSSRYSNPDDRTGYGIPNMRMAYEYLLKEKTRRDALRTLGDSYIKAYPVPFTNSLTTLYKARGNGKVSLELLDATGRRLALKTLESTAQGELYFVTFNGVEKLPGGVYFIRHIDDAGQGVIRVSK